MKSPRKPAALRIQHLAHGANLPPPAYQSDGAAGFDLVAAVDEGKPLVLKPGQSALVPTGLVFAVPSGFEAQVRPRSGLALKHGITVLNSPGTIDSDYRGEVKVLLVNLGAKLFRVHRGERIAQAVVAPVTRARLVSVTTLDGTARGAGGFGSTGVSSASTSGRKAKRVPEKKPAPANRRPAKRSKTAKPRRA